MSRLSTAKVISLNRLSNHHFLMRLDVESFVEPEPGQFYLIKVSPTLDPLLRRPFSVFQWQKGVLDFFFLVKGKGTSLMSQLLPGQEVSLLGPLGRGYPITKDNSSIVVAGGMGIASVFPLLRKLNKVILFYGARKRDELFFLKEIGEMKHIKSHFSTDDGSYGYHGSVLDLLIESSVLQKDVTLYACGPEGLLEALTEFTHKKGLKAYLSFEERMACGLGACLGCVKKTKDGMIRLCTEGPVLSMEEI